MLAADKNAWQEVRMSGDTELAREILSSHGTCAGTPRKT